jgi:hypothetical protein
MPRLPFLAPLALAAPSAEAGGIPETATPDGAGASREPGGAAINSPLTPGRQMRPAPDSADK